MEETFLKIINRPLYVDRIKPYIGQNIIKLLTGQRRVGKSYILKKVAQYIKQKDYNANIIFINLEEFAFSHITDAQGLYEELRPRLKENRQNHIFIDEIQEVHEFDRLLRSLILDEKNDIYITGSNSSMLSSEMASRLAGRNIEIRVHPLSFEEFLTFHNMENDENSLNSYLRYGGMPYLRNLPEKATWNEYLSGLTNTIVYRDIVGRYNIRNIDFLQRLLLFVSDNIGRLFTAKRISDYLKSQKIANSVSGVLNYMGYIENTYIVNKSSRWDIEGKRYFEIGEKYYFEDLGIRNSLVGYRPQDLAALIENAVYNHLRIKNYNVKTGVLSGGKEIDFVAERGNEFKYIQVALSITDRSTEEREFGNLEKIPDNYEKLVVTLNESYPNTYKGIKCLSLLQFLTDFK